MRARSVASGIAVICATWMACGIQPPPIAGLPKVGPRGSEVFANGGFEGDTNGSPPAGWTLTPFLNNKVSILAGGATTNNLGLNVIPPRALADLNLSSGVGALDTVVVGAATPESVADPDLGAGASLRYPKYGLHSVVVNNLNTTGKNQNTNLMQATMTLAQGDVDPTDGLIHIRFVAAPVLQNPSHSSWEQPYFFIQLRNVTRNRILFSTFNFAGQSGVNWKTNGTMYYTDWQLVDITPGGNGIIGDQIEMSVVAAGCSRGGHWGRVYLDAFGSTVPGLFVTGSGPSSALDNTDITYSLRYVNNSAVATNSTSISFTLPPNTTFQSLAGIAGCTTPAVGGTGTITCPVGTVPAPDPANPTANSGTFTITVHITAGTSGVLAEGNYSIQATGVTPLLGTKIETVVSSTPAHLTLVSGNNQTATVGSSFTNPLVAMVTDAGGHAVPNTTVNFTVPSTGASSTLSSYSAVSDLSGQVSVASVANLVAGAYPISAVIPSTAIAGITYTATNQAGTAVSIRVTAGSGQTAQTGDAFGQPLVVQAVDAYNNPVAGVHITWADPGTGASGTLSSNDVITDATGSAQITATANATVGTYPVTATLPGGQQASFSLTNASTAPLTIAVAAGSGQSATVGTAFSSPLSVLVTQGGSPVANTDVTFTVPGQGATATLSQIVARTDATGHAQVNATAGHTAGGYSVSATVANGAAPASFTLTNTAGAAASLQVNPASTPQTAMVGTGFTNPLVITVVDAFGNPVSGVPVTFTTPATGPGATLDVASPVSTNAAGQVVEHATANATPGTYAITVSAQGVTGTGMLSLSNSSSAPLDITVVSGLPQTATVNTAFTTSPVLSTYPAGALVVKVTDSHGNAVSGVVVTFTDPTSGPTAALSGTTATTDSAGLAAVTATANTKAGAYTVVATADQGSTSATFQLANVHGAAATLGPVSTSSPQSTVIDTTYAVPLAVQVTDAFGNPVPGATVTFSAPTSGATATLPATPTVTDANGVAQVVAIANDIAGTYPVQATSPGTTPANLQLTNTAGNPALIAIVSGASQTTEATTSFPAPIVYQVTDAHGNPVVGVPVTLTLPSTGPSATTTVVLTTGADGRVTVPLTANAQPGDFTASASIPGGAAPVAATLTISRIPTTTVLTASPENPAAQEVITYTATVTSDHGVPTGVVRFYSHGVVVAVVPLKDGVATYQIKRPDAGPLDITAVYDDTDPFDASTSAPLGLTVGPDRGTLNGGGCNAPSDGTRAWLFILPVLLGVALWRGRRRRAGAAGIALVALGLAAWPGAARAQSVPPSRGASLDFFHNAPAGSDWFSQDSLDLRGPIRPAVRLTGDYAQDPLIVYNSNGTWRSVAVREQIYIHAGVSLVFLDRFRVSANLPVLLHQYGHPSEQGGFAVNPSGKTALGDLSVAADIRLVGVYGGPAELAVGASLGIPTGLQSALTGDGRLVAAPHVKFAGMAGIFAYAAQLAFAFRRGEVGGVNFNDELRWGASAGLSLAEHRLLIGPEVYGLADFGKLLTQRRPAGLEVDLGVHYTVAEAWKFGLGAGTLAVRSPGVPNYRILASVEWMLPAPKPKPGAAARTVAVVADRDGDGVMDDKDLCPETPAGEHPDPARLGCPIKDTDGDGVADADDACPEVVAGPHPDANRAGCPDTDRDGDTVFDSVDLCPDAPAGRFPDPERAGCPLPDRDRDQVPDAVDACPDEPGAPRTDPKKNGCPGKVKIQGKQIVILSPVLFTTAKANILPMSDAVLTAVSEALKASPDIQRVSIEGHTDGQGKPAKNLALSEKRAKAVMDWLTLHGIDPERLESHGFGATRPLETNATARGRAANRRVEFHILR